MARGGSGTVRISRREFTRAGIGAATVAAFGTGNVLAGPEHLICKKIPASGETLPIVGLGTNRYGVGDSESERAPLRASLARFHQLGGTVIDTAPMYRSSEAVLGDLIGELGIRDDLFLATKTDKTGGQSETFAQMQESMRRLKTERIDLMQVHNLLGWQDALPAIREWQREGRIRYVGITTSREDQYGDFEAVMRQERLDFVQLNYSLEQRTAAERLLPLAADRGMAVIVNRAFGGGRIFEKVGDQPLPDWAQAFGCETWAQFLLKYVLGHPAVTLSIPGMTKPSHVDDNLWAGHGRLPTAEERKRQEAFFDAL